MEKFGKVVLSSIPDITFVSELQNNGILLMQSYANMVQIVATGFNSMKKKELASFLGVVQIRCLVIVIVVLQENTQYLWTHLNLPMHFLI